MALISNPDNPISPQGILVLASIFTGIVWILAGTRFWVLRHYRSRRFSPRWISDLAVFLIVIFMTVSLGLLFYVYHLVMDLRVLDAELDELDAVNGHHKRGDASLLEGSNQETLEEDLMNQYTDVTLKIMKCSLAWRLFCTTALWLVKFSIAMVYVELLDTLTRKLRWMVYTALTTIISTFVVVIVLFGYGMPSENWGEEKQSQLPIVTEYFYGAANIFTDLQVLILALWALSVIKLPQSKIYAVSLLLFMGFITVSLATARAIMYDLHIRTDTELHQSVDIIGLIEPLVASWLACLPALRVLLRMRRRSRDEEGDIRLRMNMQCSQDDPIQIRSRASSRVVPANGVVTPGDMERYDSFSSTCIGVALGGTPTPEHFHRQTLEDSITPPVSPQSQPHEHPDFEAKLRYSHYTPDNDGEDHSYADVADVVDAYGEAYTSDEEDLPPFSANTTAPLDIEAEKKSKKKKKKVRNHN